MQEVMGGQDSSHYDRRSQRPCERLHGSCSNERRLTVAGFKSRAGAEADIAYHVEQAPTLLAGCDDASVIIAPAGYSQAAYDKFVSDDKSATLKAKGGSYGGE